MFLDAQSVSLLVENVTASYKQPAKLTCTVNNAEIQATNFSLNLTVVIQRPPGLAISDYTL